MTATNKSNLISYDPRGPSFTDKVLSTRDEVKQSVHATFSTEIERINSIFNFLYRRQSCYTWLYGVSFCADFSSSSHRLAFVAFHKGLIALASAMKLVESGLTGATYSQIRYAFEAVVTAKYFRMLKDDLSADAWFDGKDFYFTNVVLKKIPKKFGLPLREYWNDISQVNHFTASSGQIVLSTDVSTSVNGPTSESSLVHIEKLLHFFAHLQRRYIITTSARYYTFRYSEELAHLDQVSQKQLTVVLAASSRYLLSKDRQFIRHFSAAWR